jgi:mannose-6-phosphate isomerase-like protein (cupin superfamily)
MIVKLDDFVFNGISGDVLSFEDFLSSPYLYDQGLVKIIKGERSYDAYSVSDVLANYDKPIKIEGFERFSQSLYDECERLAEHFNHAGPITCHLFISPKDSMSFPMHVDLDDVVVHMVSGEKVFESPSGDFVLSEGDSLFIPRGTEHRAINTESSVMLSFGLERFINEKL